MTIYVFSNIDKENQKLIIARAESESGAKTELSKGGNDPESYELEGTLEELKGKLESLTIEDLSPGTGQIVEFEQIQ